MHSDGEESPNPPHHGQSRRDVMPLHVQSSADPHGGPRPLHQIQSSTDVKAAQDSRFPPVELSESESSDAFWLPIIPYKRMVHTILKCVTDHGVGCVGGRVGYNGGGGGIGLGRLFTSFIFCLIAAFSSSSTASSRSSLSSWSSAFRSRIAPM